MLYLLPSLIFMLVVEDRQNAVIMRIVGIQDRLTQHQHHGIKVTPFARNILRTIIALARSTTLGRAETYLPLQESVTTAMAILGIDL